MGESVGEENQAIRNDEPFRRWRQACLDEAARIEAELARLPEQPPSPQPDPEAR
jgi:hypothetical protein